MGAKRTNTNFHPFASLRKVLKLSQAAFAKEIEASLSLIGKIETFSRPVPREISNLVLKTYGAWVPPGTYEDVDHSPFPLEADQLPPHLFMLERQAFVFASKFEDWRELATCLEVDTAFDTENQRFFHKEIHYSSTKVILPSSFKPTLFNENSKERVFNSDQRIQSDADAISGYSSQSKEAATKETFIRAFRFWLQMSRMQHHHVSGASNDYLQFQKTGDQLVERLFVKNLGDEIKAEFERFGRSLSDFFPGLKIAPDQGGLELLQVLLEDHPADMLNFLDQAAEGWCTGFAFLQGLRSLQRLGDDGTVEVQSIS